MTLRNKYHWVIFISMMANSPLVFPYKVENNTGREAYFYGQFCAACWHAYLMDGESGACNGHDAGCRNTTWVYEFMGDKYRNSRCFRTSNVPVTSHGRIVFSKEIHVYDDMGKLIDKSSGQLYYEGLFGILTKTNHCNPE